jgi:L-lactate dehydrogenase complex protein LldG
MTAPAHAGAARAEILARIRAAQSPAQPSPVPRDYHAAGTHGTSGLADLLADRLADYGANVLRCRPAAAPAAIRTALADAGARRVAIPDGLPEQWAAAAAVPLAETQVSGRAGLTVLETTDAVVTTVTAAIAQTGTLVLDHGPGQGRRELTLIPDLHLAVVAWDRIVATVPDAIARLAPGASLTWVSGPSATSDIELNRIEGVHGPRTLITVILDDLP